MSDTERLKPTRGTCVFCGKDYAKSGMTRHLQACQARTEANEDAASKKRKPQTIYHITATGLYGPDYWMHFEVPARAKLTVVDSYLRDMWLECCGHLSSFFIDNETYSSPVYGGSYMDDKSMEILLKNVLSVGDAFRHIYDYGTSTELNLKVVDAREGVPLDSIHLMARNHPPKIMCQNCGEQEATLVCTFCIYSGEGWVCSKCKTEHACYKEEGDDYMFLPVVNSPRVGMCGYVGDVSEW